MPWQAQNEGLSPLKTHRLMFHAHFHSFLGWRLFSTVFPLRKTPVRFINHDGLARLCVPLLFLLKHPHVNCSWPQSNCRFWWCYDHPQWMGIIPESVWAKGSSNSGGLSNIFTSHIFTSSHLHIFTSSHPRIFTSSHLHIFSSSHLHITSSHLLTFTSSHLHIVSSSHLHILTSSHRHIFSSSHRLIFTSSHPHIFTSSHLHIFTFSLALLLSCPLALLPSCFLLLFYFSLKARGSANEKARNATLSHETTFDRQKLK